MNQDALRILAKELTGEQFKVLMLMLADLGLRKLHSDRPSRYC